MKQILKQVTIFILFVIFTQLITVSVVLAANYGEGTYSIEEYGVGQSAQQPGTSNSTSTSTPQNLPVPPGCSNPQPGSKAPWLYAAVPQNNTSILLYFAAGDDPFDHYAIEYGTKAGEYSFGSPNFGGREDRVVLIKSLSPGSTYYFRIRGGNGCAPGPWSNEIAATTLSGISLKRISIVDTTLERNNTSEEVEPKTDMQQKEEQEEGYTVNVTVLDANSTPVEGAVVTIHSNVQEAVTDSQGQVRFSNVEHGQHKVLIAYDGYEGEQSINVTGDTKDLDLTITIETKNVLTSPIVLTIVGTLLCVIVILLYFLFKKNKSK